MKHGVLVMTALLPTVGHKYLIDFAARFMQQMDGHLTVITCIRPGIEPKESLDRIWDIATAANQLNWNVTCVTWADDNAPQNPSDCATESEFWDYWVTMIPKAIAKGDMSSNGLYTNAINFDYMFASEHYGAKYAEALGIEFIPVDIERVIYPVKGTEVRANIYRNWHNILEQSRGELKRQVTFFGAESTGKTTISKMVHDHYKTARFPIPTHWSPEWARPYLEAVGKEITDKKMENIAYGQNALESEFWNNDDWALALRDTDLLSTVGYYRIYRGSEPEFIGGMISLADLYIVMPDTIPFVPDQLRYGGDKRESNTKFWTDLLDEFGANYVVLNNTDRKWQVIEAVGHIEKMLYNKEIIEYETFTRD